MTSKTAKCRETGVSIETTVYENGTVQLICVDHSSTVDFDSAYEAKPFKAHPSEWCEACADIVYGKSEVAA